MFRCQFVKLMPGYGMYVTDTAACYCEHTNIWSLVTADYRYDINLEMSFFSSIFIG